MLSVLSHAQSVLEGASFATKLTTLNRRTVLCFEDGSVTGFAVTFASVEELLEEWQMLDDAILRTFTPQLRKARDKAWNVYTVLLCTDSGTPAAMHRTMMISENLERTRKLSAVGVRTREDVLGALLPLLPLQNTPTLQPEDLTSRFRGRISQIAPHAVDAILSSSTTPTDVADLLAVQ